MPLSSGQGKQGRSATPCGSSVKAGRALLVCNCFAASRRQRPGSPDEADRGGGDDVCDPSAGVSTGQRRRLQGLRQLQAKRCTSSAKTPEQQERQPLAYQGAEFRLKAVHQQQQQQPLPSGQVLRNVLEAPQNGYANLPARRQQQQKQKQQQQQGCREYANLPWPPPTPPSPWQQAEQRDRSLNYMDIDYSTGVGVPPTPAAGDSQPSSSGSRLVYAQLVSGGAPSTSNSHSHQAKGEINYCQLDLKAMAALEATAKEEERLLSRHHQHHQRQHSQRQASQPGGRDVGSSVLPRIRSTVSRSVSRLSATSASAVRRQ